MAISQKILDYMEKASWIRKMFEEGANLKKKYGNENVYDFSLGNPCLDPPDRFFDTLADEILDRPVFNEEKGAPQGVLDGITGKFKASDGGVLFSVMGGRLSEGLDFPGRSMELAVLVGVPFPKPTARSKGLLRYYDYRFKKGWEYVVRAPTARKLAQTVGRLIRSEDDRGYAVLLDERGRQFTDAFDIRPETDAPLAISEFFSWSGK